MNAVSAIILVVLLMVVTLGPRRWALLAMMAGVLFLTQGNAVDLAGLNLYPVRFLEFAAFGRVLGRGELVWSRLNRIDWAVLLLYNYTALVWIVRSSDVTAQQFAYGLDASLCYLALRGLIASLDDVRWLLYASVALFVPYTALVFVERLTGSTSFGIVGATWGLYVREGVPRCQGSFRHPILLGSVAASFLAVYIGLWKSNPQRLAAAAGGMLSLALVFLSHSGGPATSAGAVLFGWALWKLRAKMHLVRWSALAVLALLLVFMKAPIWYLPFKVSSIVGGGGYHRSLLMERAWQHLDEWWLVGMDIGKTASWIPYVHDLVGGADITNQFVALGIKAGLPAILMSFAVLWFVFSGIGRLLAAAPAGGDAEGADALLLWGLGVAVFSHAVSWIGVAYFDQSWVIWLMHVAAVSSAVQAVEFRADAGTPAVRARRARSFRTTGAPVQRGTVTRRHTSDARGTTWRQS